MKIHWQSFIDESASRPYMERLSAYLNAVAAPGTEVVVRGISPPDRDFGRLSEMRCAVLAIDNALQAEEDGFDACVIGHFQDPGLYEMRSALQIPVIGAGEATLYAALTLGRRLGLVTLDPVFETWHYEQAERMGIADRVRHVTGMACRPEDFSAAFAGDTAAKEQMLADFSACARPLVEAGADVIVPAGVLPGLLIGGEKGFRVGHAPVINCASVGLKAAEMWASLRGIDGIGPSRGPSFALAPDRARADFRALVRDGRPR
ncbi:aspartate/glutamate racemase family protein [Acidimangrovimonas sediminis]|uniref:aspartate/glutamate racemase family protein n=1 Tax=Acidimangrovimonas sediminis TaxID=2056283 RepID=UPI0018ED1343|nr:aspartate/glutamate racemase family protein [Acidimangrovimonas sediminis]